MKERERKLWIIEREKWKKWEEGEGEKTEKEEGWRRNGQTMEGERNERKKS